MSGRGHGPLLTCAFPLRPVKWPAQKWPVPLLPGLPCPSEGPPWASRIPLAASQPPSSGAQPLLRVVAEGKGELGHRQHRPWCVVGLSVQCFFVLSFDLGNRLLSSCGKKLEVKRLAQSPTASWLWGSCSNSCCCQVMVRTWAWSSVPPVLQK